ncbi:MAG: hypothetical protein QOD74_2665 [Variibacter sp.]|jgi:hypothetical protein|nr:hypothetical protein [Variibacter sp.]
MKYAVSLAALLACTSVASAAEFFVVQDSSTKRCQIVEQRPTTSTTVVVGGDRMFSTRTEAETAMRTIKVCDGGPSTGTTTIVR